MTNLVGTHSPLKAAKAAKAAWQRAGNRARRSQAFVTDRKRHDRRYAPRRDFAQGFRETLEWYLANKGWWRPLLDRG